MSINGYQFSALSESEIDDIKKLEDVINNQRKERVILLAFNDEG